MDQRYAAYRELKIDRPSDGVLRVTLDGAGPMNTLSVACHGELATVWRDADHDASVRAILLRAEGENFSAGGDFDFVQRMIDDVDFRLAAMNEARDLVFNIVNCSKPIVSAMQGAAAGGALAAGLLADISVASSTARLIDGHVRLGVAAGDHAALLWPLLCGLAKAKYHLLLNEPITGAMAEKIGLVSLSVEDDALQRTAGAIAERLAAGSATAIRMTKRALNNWIRAATPVFEASLAMEMLGFSGRDAREGLASFKEKRKPSFQAKD